jgi:hypothetical protein
MGRRVLFVIRSKLGDSLICYQSVREYIDRHPGDEVWLAIRSDYARLLEREPGLHLIAFGSRAAMIAKLAWRRLTAPPFDVLAILWGFGAPIRRIAQLVRARRKIYIDARHAPLIPEHPPTSEYHSLADPAWLVTRVFDPDHPKPDRLRLPGLHAQRAETRDRVGAIAVVPLANELRRNMDAPTLALVLAKVRALHPDRPLWILLNPGDRGADRVLPVPLPAGVEVKRFRALTELLPHYFQLDGWYGTDTGLYHLAVAMGIPATAFFGPTQARKIVMPGQPEATWARLEVLANDHCEEKGCDRPLCLHQAIATWCGAATATRLDETPPACPLRAFPKERLPAITLHENPRHQA